MHNFILQLAQENDFQSTRLLKMLHAIQKRYFYIPENAIETLAEQLHLPRTHIQNVVAFYSFFHTQSSGKYTILISDSITDLMLGKADLMSYFAQQLKVDIGCVRADGLVSLNNTSCTGLCDQGPAGLVNGYALTRLTKPRIDQIVDYVNRDIPLAQWDADLFHVDDNIVKPDLLLNEKPLHGQAIASTLRRGLSETLAEIELSGLRGRGGAGYTTAWKWKFCREEDATQTRESRVHLKIVCCLALMPIA